MTGDARLRLARADLASAELQGQVRAERFAQPRVMQTTAPATSVRCAPDSAAEQVDQLLFGEVFEVLEVSGDFAWGQARRDGYVGHVAITDLSAPARQATHRVSALRAFAFDQPAIRAPATGPYSLNALLTVIDERGDFALASGAGWLPKALISAVDRVAPEPAAVVESLVGAPYLWGGRDSLGLDCSGLVQQALYACGLSCPRDADLQQALGTEVPADALRRGDLVFWKGHVGMMIDPERLCHANGHHMCVTVELLTEAVERIRAAGVGVPTAYRRL